MKTAKIEILTKPGVRTLNGRVYPKDVYENAVDLFMKREHKPVTVYGDYDRVLAGDVGTFVGQVISIKDGFAEVEFYDNFKFNHDDFKLVTNGIGSIGEDSVVSSFTLTALEIIRC